MFRHAIVRVPSENFAEGITTSELGEPDYPRALAQHAAYVEALRTCGLEVTVLPPDSTHPDSTFVEDAAVVTMQSAILTNPGADSRKGEVAAIRAALSKFYDRFLTIAAPGTLDGGDICEADGHFFIGLSERTNREGAQQLADFLAQDGYTSSLIPVNGIPGLLHLKSGIAYLGDEKLVLIDALAGREEFQKYHCLRVAPEEAYAANCVRINETVLMAAGFPRLKAELARLGYKTLELETSEFEKMDGGLSCLSLRLERAA